MRRNLMSMAGVKPIERAEYLPPSSIGKENSPDAIESLEDSRFKTKFQSVTIQKKLTKQTIDLNLQHKNSPDNSKSQSSLDGLLEEGPREAVMTPTSLHRTNDNQTLSVIYQNDGQFLTEITVEGAESLSSQEAQLLTRFDRSGSPMVDLGDSHGITTTEFDLSATPDTSKLELTYDWHNHNQF